MAGELPLSGSQDDLAILPHAVLRKVSTKINVFAERGDPRLARLRDSDEGTWLGIPLTEAKKFVGDVRRKHDEIPLHESRSETCRLTGEALRSRGKTHRARQFHYKDFGLRRTNSRPRSQRARMPFARTRNTCASTAQTAITTRNRPSVNRSRSSNADRGTQPLRPGWLIVCIVRNVAMRITRAAWRASR